MRFHLACTQRLNAGRWCCQYNVDFSTTTVMRYTGIETNMCRETTAREAMVHVMFYIGHPATRVLQRLIDDLLQCEVAPRGPGCFVTHLA